MPALFYGRLANQSPFTIKCSKRRLTRIAFCLVCCLLLWTALLPSQVLAGESIIYTGNAGDLKTGAIGGSDTAPGSVFSATSASGNTVTVNFTSGTAPHRVFGGLSATEAVTGNTVNFISGSTVNNVYGGYDAGNNHSSGNTLNITGGTIGGHAVGGLSLSGNATGNKVSMSSGTVTWSLYGGSANEGKAENNSVIISGGQVGDDTEDGDGILVNGWVTGGDSYSGRAVGNSVTLHGGIVNHIQGGQSRGAAGATGNYVLIAGGEVKGNVQGAWGNGDVSGNSVVINGGDVATHQYATVTGGISVSGSAFSNSVTINAGNVSGSVFGGDSHGNAYNNQLVINGGNFSNDGRVWGGASWDGNATGNTVAISGGLGFLEVIGGQSTTGAAGGNSVAISGGTFASGSQVRGGFSGNVSGDATHNTISISGSPYLAETSLFGGVSAREGSDVRTGNTLNLHSPVTVKSAQNFENWNFYLPSAMAAGGAMLTVTETAALGPYAKISVGIAGSSAPLRQGDTVNLIKAPAAPAEEGLSGTLASNRVEGRQGVTLKYELDLLADAAKGLLTATVSGGPVVNEQAKALSEGFIGGVGLLTQGGDLAAGPGTASAVSAAQGAGGAMAGFGGFSGGGLRLKSGSHVDTKGFSLLAGLSKGWDSDPGRLTLGAFFEYGKGNYDTYNSFASGTVRGDGDTRHFGGGLLGRLDFTETAAGRPYVEGSFRAGGVRNEYKSFDLRDATGVHAEYDSSSAYLGAHLGGGYIWNLSEAASLDLYGKYFWTRQGGDSVTLSTGDPINFEAVNSHRLRAGTRLAFTVNEHVIPYVGAAYEHESGGKVKATAYGLPIDAPSLRGGTGIGELGLNIKPVAGSPFSFDLGVQGYTGKREGVTGSLQLRFEF